MASTSESLTGWAVYCSRKASMGSQFQSSNLWGETKSIGVVLLGS